MDRRSFLKSLGLGGLALTLPKSLEVVAAKMSDLKDPPIQAGICRFRGLEKFPLYGFNLVASYETALDSGRFDDLISHWQVHAVIRRDARSYIHLLDAPIIHELVINAPQCEVLPWRGRDLSPGFSTNLLAGDSLEVWIVSDGEAKYPLPPLQAVLYGPPKGSSFTSMMLTECLFGSIRTVRLERTRAIELGLVSPRDPFETI